MGLVGLVGGVGKAVVVLVGGVDGVREPVKISIIVSESPRANLNSLMRLFLSVMKSTSLTLKSGRCV